MRTAATTGRNLTLDYNIYACLKEFHSGASQARSPDQRRRQNYQIKIMSGIFQKTENDQYIQISVLKLRKNMGKTEGLAAVPSSYTTMLPGG